MKYLLFFTCVFVVCLGVRCDPCAYADACVCVNDTVSCLEEDMFSMPIFSTFERRYAKVLNMRKTRLRDVPKMSKFNWPYLHVSVYFPFFRLV